MLQNVANLAWAYGAMEHDRQRCEGLLRACMAITVERLCNGFRPEFTAQEVRLGLGLRRPP